MTTRNELLDWYWKGVKMQATHMVVVCDTFDWGDYPVFVMPGQDARQVVRAYDGKDMQKVMEVYNLALGEEQVTTEGRVFNF